MFDHFSVRLGHQVADAPARALQASDFSPPYPRLLDARVEFGRAMTEAVLAAGQSDLQIEWRPE